MAKLPRGRSARQEEINRLIVERALAGQRVARFKGGDSFVFGRGFEEIEACRAAGVRGPGDPRALQPAGGPGPGRHPGHPPRRRPRVHGGLRPPPPGHADSLVDWDAVGRLRGTVLLMMAVENAPHIADGAAQAAGRPADTPVAVVCDGSMPGERTVLSTLGELAADLDRHAVRPPAIIVVGEVVAVAHPDAFGGRAGSGPWQS